MAVVDDEPQPGAGPVITIVAVAAFLIVVAILFYGLYGLHWFGVNAPATVGTAPSVTPTPTPAASAAASPSAT